MATKTKKDDLPGTLKRSPAKAQRSFAETLDSAHEEYDSERRAHRTAYASLKHSFEKVGDHWEPKKKKGPSAVSGGSGAGPLQHQGLFQVEQGPSFALA
jgi:cation transport regulator ChaB